MLLNVTVRSMRRLKLSSILRVMSSNFVISNNWMDVKSGDKDIPGLIDTLKSLSFTKTRLEFFLTLQMIVVL